MRTAEQIEDDLVKALVQVTALRKERDKLLSWIGSHESNMDTDYPPRGSSNVMWAVFGPYRVLSGGVFHHRKNAIAFAEQSLGMKWPKARRMGYFCEKVTIQTK